MLPMSLMSSWQKSGDPEWVQNPYPSLLDPRAWAPLRLRI